MNNNSVMGVFIGLESARFEYIANIIAPYQANFSLEIGDFLLIDSNGKYLVSRVTEYRPTGELSMFMGLKWLGDVAGNLDAIGLDIKEKKIRYTVRIKILGTLEGKKFVPGVKSIPHITSKVFKPTQQQLREIISTVNNLQEGGQTIGTLYMDSSINVKFAIAEMNSKRTFIFARAGYGKSNLMKLIASSWPKGEGGLVIFDPEGEYAITDHKKRPGIMDQREAVLVTNRNTDHLRQMQNVYHYMKLNLKEFDPKFILPIIISPAKYENIFFYKLMSMERESWGALVDLLYTKKWGAPLEEVVKIVTGNNEDPKDFQPVLNNLVRPVLNLHDPNSQLIRIVTEALKKEEVVILDISLLDSATALQLSSLIVHYVFNHNQTHFTDHSGNIIKATFVVEEAQSVIGKNSKDATFVELAKEGRKYNLGGVFITQQPESIPFEILSQSDNFFVFHLLSRFDLEGLSRANAHYSEDVLTQILSEPVPGKCYMWTSQQPFVLPVMIKNFEEDISKRDKSIEIQAKSTLLQDIEASIRAETTDPIMVSILNKFYMVEREHRGEEIGKRTKELFRRLSQEERVYLNENGYIQKSKADGVPFAVTDKFYHSLRK